MNSMNFPNIEQLVFFRNLLKHPIIKKFNSLKSCQMKESSDDYLMHYFELKSAVLDFALQNSNPTAYASTPWQHFILSEIITNENSLTRYMEKKSIEANHPMLDSFLNDFEILSDLFTFNWMQFLTDRKIDDDHILYEPVFNPAERRKNLSDIFSKGDPNEILSVLNQYLLKNGLGIFEQSHSFKVDSHLHLIPVVSHKDIFMTDLIGYEAQKKALIENTTAFVQKRQGLNVLLQGDMGTGKSTMVKALLHEFDKQNLKMVEIKRNQLPALQEIMTCLGKRPYPFIIFIDDLSFDENDENFMLFKNCLEGSLEDNHDNIRIYTTSNKRHLITETRSERDDAIHARDIIQEKLSLSARFGLIINFSTPDQKEYLHIVKELAKTSGLDIEDENLNAMALQWEIRHLNRSGRTAEQFIKSLLS